MFAVFLYEMFGIDVNYFERSEEPGKSNKDLFTAHIMGLVSLVGIYLLRFVISVNSYVFLVIVSAAFMIYAVCACHLLSESHYLLEHTAY